MKIEIQPYKLVFKQPAGTSRGVYRERFGWYVVVDGKAVGECAPLPDLSSDFLRCGKNLDERLVTFENFLCKFAKNPLLIEAFDDESSVALPPELVETLRAYPSILFAFESAKWRLGSGGFTSVDSKFARGESPVTINGLVWMGTYEEMKMRMEEKLALGFKCIKLKIGAIDFESELSLIEQIRNDFPPSAVTIRVDANGAFQPSEALAKLSRLSEFDIHSIEQPVKAGQWSELATLCAVTPLPIALDEELIGVDSVDDKIKLLDTVKPQQIVLKPTLHGGISGTMEWIKLARERETGYWLTSALESNVGLESIAHLCGVLADKYPETAELPQGLGTGALFTTNQPSQLRLEGDRMWWNK